ncbi:ImmA/IrrE family metallo-endopeptidase [Halobacteriovorax sp. HLS]|uniref:ImmA/IrrE family metallo-endopeptidase n=1 Tax=Halobacteriovorax sp. HLS TaxID=2234000 RepID=UPI000FD7D909|nr:ImmA/IrrE family metallo-endopeptidase [Halobacteriovorax sp. HLS]
METSKRDMIQIDGAYLKARIKDRELMLKDSQDLFGISRTRLSTCINENTINRKLLYKIASKLKLSKSEFNEAMGQKPLQVFFRKERLEEPHIEEIEKVRSFVSTFIKVFEFKKPEEALPTFNHLNAADLAKQIRKTLSIVSASVSIEYVIDTLQVFGVHVYFCPFRFMGLNQDPKSKKLLRAASIPVADNWLILLDTSKSKEDVFFDLIHELAHIFAGHDHVQKHDKEIEDYCQSVGKEFFTPSSFFDYYAEDLRTFFVGIDKKSKAVGHVDKIRIHLGASFEGVVLKLKEAKIITSQLQGYLYAVVNNKKKNTKSLDYFFQENWFENLDDDIYKYYYKLFIEARYLYQEERLTQRSIGALFGLDYGESSQLVDLWYSEIKNTTKSR